MIRDKNIQARSRRAKSKEARLSRLEQLVQELKQKLERLKNPNQRMTYFVAPGAEPPDPDTLPPDAIVVYFKPSPRQLEIEEEYKARAEAAEVEHEAYHQAEAERKEKLAQEIAGLDPEPAKAGAATKQFDQNGERVIAEGYGVRWGEFEPIQHRYKDPPNRDWHMLNRSGIF